MFESKYFVKTNFTPEQINQYLNNALRDINIAKSDNNPEVKFIFSYNALIKAGIALIANTGKVKVRSIPGHHVIILEKMSELLKDETVMNIGNAMRMKRNEDLYSGGIFISIKESVEYTELASKMIMKIKKMIKDK